MVYTSLINMGQVYINSRLYKPVLLHWEKYTYSTLWEAYRNSSTNGEVHRYDDDPRSIYVGTGYTFDSVNGFFNLTGTTYIDVSNWSSRYPYRATESGATMMRQFVRTSENSNQYTHTFYYWNRRQKTVLGSLVGIVSGVEGQYPTDGAHTDGYWYKLISE